MDIHLFNFLENHNEEIVDLVLGEIDRERAVYKRLSEAALRHWVERYLDCYSDALITNEMEAFDRLFRVMVRLMTRRNIRFSDVIEALMLVETTVRDLIIREDPGDGSAKVKLERAIESVGETARGAACRFVDVFQDHLSGRIAAHNIELDLLAAETGRVVPRLRVGTEERA